tara:strand:- start:1303 stop:1917 length:615 start_codon:yes stop_codon:yes gene_type:complete
MDLKCSNCGAINSSDQISCEYCGADLGVRGNSKFNSLMKSKGDITNDLSNSIDSTSFKYRDQGKVAMLFIFTCGIYYFFLLADWLKVIKKNKKFEGLTSIDPGLAVFLTIITCSAASIYFNYKVARDAASISRKSGGNSSPKRNGMNPPLESLPEIILWGGIISFFLSIISSGVLVFINIIFGIWSIIALQKSVEYMAGVKPNT